jgi:trehalose 6-phosphate synthase
MNVTSLHSGQQNHLWDLVEEMVSRHRLILASNRGPIDHYVDGKDNIRSRRGSGGVVTALSSLINYVDMTWIASAMSEGDRRAADEHPSASIKSTIPGQQMSIRYVLTPRRMYHKYYNMICNPLLWFLQHSMWSSAYTPNVDAAIHDAWDAGYVSVNQLFAKTIVEEAATTGSYQPYIMLHDYHLYLVARFVRQQLPNALIQHFIHIPWAASTYWELIPAKMRYAICESLCSADIVGFQSMRDVRSFLESVRTFLPDVEIDHRNLQVSHANRITQIRAYPISIDVAEVRRIAVSRKAREYESRLGELLCEKNIIRVDRAEPSKNIVRGFHAFEMLLRRYPKLRGKTKFLAFLVPSRTHVRQYQRYREEIENQIQSINNKYGTKEWKPITVFFENNYVQAIAAMHFYDVLLVNAVVDGMNLVAKEGPIVNRKNGVLILSEAAGAHEQLHDGAISIAPADLEGTTQALYQALTMSSAERAQRAMKLIRVIEKEDITHWLYQQLTDLHARTGTN